MNCPKLLTVIALASMTAAGQQTPSHAEGAQLRTRTIARENWQAQGRRIPGLNSAAPRNRAIQQKLRMRLMQAASSTSTSGSWTLVGPLPLPSDASGSGIQDYNW